MDDRLGRRSLLRASLLAGLGLVAAACAPAAAPRWTFAPPARRTASGPLVRIVAADFAFDLAEFSIPVGAPFQIEFDHRDVDIPHNVAIYATGPDGPALFRGEIVNGPTVIVYDVPALPAGTHAFLCDPHPYMLGEVSAS